MSINFYSIKSLRNIKDENIIFDDGFYSKKKINYQDTHIFYAKLTYISNRQLFCLIKYVILWSYQLIYYLQVTIYKFLYAPIYQNLYLHGW